MPNDRVSPGGATGDTEAQGSGLRRFATWKLALVGTAAVLVVVGGGVGAGVALSGSTGSDTQTVKTTQVPDGLNQTTQVPDGLNQTTEVLDGLNQTTQVPDEANQTTQVPDGVNQTTQAPDSENQTTQVHDDLNQTTVSSNETSWNITTPPAENTGNHTIIEGTVQDTTLAAGTKWPSGNQTRDTTEAVGLDNNTVTTPTRVEDTQKPERWMNETTHGSTTSVLSSTVRAINESTTTERPETSTAASPTSTVVVITPTPTAASTWQRTTIFLFYSSSAGENVFLRGGISSNQRICSGSADLANDPCALPIRYNTIPASTHFADYRAWSSGDSYLDWNGKEPSQGTRARDNREANGSPAVWTTDTTGQSGYVPLNKYGQHYWYLDIIMDCSKSERGWFDLKGYVARDSGGGFWENQIVQAGSCTGSAGGNRPYDDGNHLARCGKINVFRFNEGSCIIENY